MRRVHAKDLFCFAWGQTMHDVIGQTRGQRIARALGGVAILAVAYGYVRLVNTESHAFSDTVKSFLLATAALVVVWTAVFLYHFLFEGPYQLVQTQIARADELERKLHPNAEFDAEWDRLIAADRRPSAHPFVEALKRDSAERTYQSMVEARKPTRDISLSNGLAYILSFNWDGEIDELFPDHRKEFEHALDDVIQRARDGKITVWGRPTEDAPWKVVPAEHWEDYRVDVLHAVIALPRSEPRRGMDADGIYYQLKISKREFEKEWPGAR